MKLSSTVDSATDSAIGDDEREGTSVDILDASLLCNSNNGKEQSQESKPFKITEIE